jgi:hypothetical protein
MFPLKAVLYKVATAPIIGSFLRNQYKHEIVVYKPTSGVTNFFINQAYICSCYCELFGQQTICFYLCSNVTVEQRDCVHHCSNSFFLKHCKDKRGILAGKIHKSNQENNDDDHSLVFAALSAVNNSLSMTFFANRKLAKNGQRSFFILWWIGPDFLAGCRLFPGFSD